MTASMSLKEYEDVRITVPWGYIAGRWHGNRQVRPILAIHGWLDNLGTFDKLIPLLPAHIGILCIDLPGHGRSSHHPSGIRYSVYDYLPVIIRIMKEYNWKRVSLLGHSLGAALCFIYTSLYPHTVDLLIAIDIITPPINTSKHIMYIGGATEKLLIENERFEQMQLNEPPSHTYEELERKLYDGSHGSVNLENAKYLLDRAIQKSKLFPNKYYFSRDGRVKYYQYFVIDSGLAAEMARRIKNVPYLVIKGSDSTYINKSSDEVINILSTQNSHFEYHEIKGTHHIHLNNMVECAEIIVPFLYRFRPATLDSWTLAENDDTTAGRRKAQERFFAWHQKRARKTKPKSKL